MAIENRTQNNSRQALPAIPAKFYQQEK